MTAFRVARAVGAEFCSYRSLLALFVALVFAAVAAAEPEDAVVKVPSHGGSGVVIATGHGWTKILTAAHLFERGGRDKAITIDAPAPTHGPARKVGIEVLAVDPERDLGLMLLHAGPLPYVCPVPDSAEYQPSGDLVSVGYDEMRPRTIKAATIVEVTELWIHTQQKPWHGRSGGGLIDRRTNALIGIVSSYENLPGGRGVYCSRRSILEFLRAGGPSADQAGRRRAAPQRSFAIPRPAPRPAPGGC